MRNKKPEKVCAEMDRTFLLASAELRVQRAISKTSKNDTDTLPE